jgi:hypothetical protein
VGLYLVAPEVRRFAGLVGNVGRCFVRLHHGPVEGRPLVDVNWM